MPSIESIHGSLLQIDRLTNDLRRTEREAEAIKEQIGTERARIDGFLHQVTSCLIIAEVDKRFERDQSEQSPEASR